MNSSAIALNGSKFTVKAITKSILQILSHSFFICFPEDQPLKGYEFYPSYPPHQQEKADGGDDDSAIPEEQRPANMIDESEKMNPVEPVYIPGVARSVSALMAQLARLFQEQDQQRDRSQHQQIDRKLRREIDEKKQAMGIRD